VLTGSTSATTGEVFTGDAWQEMDSVSVSTKGVSAIDITTSESCMTGSAEFAASKSVGTSTSLHLIRFLLQKLG